MFDSWSCCFFFLLTHYCLTGDIFVQYHPVMWICQWNMKHQIQIIMRSLSAKKLNRKLSKFSSSPLIGDANLQISSLAEELAKKTEDASRQQEEITHLLSQIVDLQKKVKCVSAWLYRWVTVCSSISLRAFWFCLGILQGYSWWCFCVDVCVAVRSRKWGAHAAPGSC